MNHALYNQKLNPEPPWFKVRKTVSAEVNYGIRFSGWQDAEHFLNQLAGSVIGHHQQILSTKPLLKLFLLVLVSF